ncbi:MAG TPA: apolipoprotein N-acyltransferase [Pyrinomonadaceae bacterium]|nr:apolipoprotein N-acyltransferase [Pyrinomonadaceae bacterium]
MSSTALIISFPNFDLWFLAWFALVPLLVLVGRGMRPWPAFFVGWLFGSVFFYGTCYWLTYSMIHFGGIPAWIAYPMLAPGAIVLGLFPGFFLVILARAVRSWGHIALLLAPIIWASMEWMRLGVTGQLWNAIGYSLAFQTNLIQVARYGGVYAVGFVLVMVNALSAYVVIKNRLRATAVSALLLLIVCAVVLLTDRGVPPLQSAPGDAIVVAIQPNVPMSLVKSTEEMTSLNTRHFEMSAAALAGLENDGSPRLLVWPESPMNFTYGKDTFLRERLKQFAELHQTSILLNSQEAAPNEGIYNSAVLVNQQGSLVSQYDKIRLLPFGEYVPLPQWLPGAGLIRGIVGDFTPGTNYPLMTVGNVRIGVFICIESAYPNIPRQFAHDGADVLVNISNDGYLGPTAVLRQHLANAVFRAVENNRPVLRVTNTGITALILPNGEVKDATVPFKEDVRIWKVNATTHPPTFYARHGDLFAMICGALTLIILILSFAKFGRTTTKQRL